MAAEEGGPRDMLLPLAVAGAVAVALLVARRRVEPVGKVDAGAGGGDEPEDGLVHVHVHGGALAAGGDLLVAGVVAVF